MQTPPPPPPPPPGGYPAPPPGGYPPPPAGGYPPAPLSPYRQQGYGYQAAGAYGGFWIRLVAVIIDGFIVAIPLFLLGIVIGVTVGVGTAVSGNANSPDLTGGNPGLTAFLDFVSFVLSAGYFIYFWGVGATPGMRLLKLRVADAGTGAPIGFGRAVLRYVGYILSIIVCYVGLIWAAFDGRKQGWHDKIAGTVVLQG